MSGSYQRPFEPFFAKHFEEVFLHVPLKQFSYRNPILPNVNGETE